MDREVDLAAALLLCVYLAPFAVAEAYEHRHRYAILALNVMTGWTGVGWVAALVWALRGRPRPPRPPPSLYVVGRPAPVTLPSFWRTTRSALVVGGTLSICAAVLAFVPRARPVQSPVAARASLAVERVEVRRGPSERWERVGSIETPCRVYVSAREGAWRRIWPLPGCGGQLEGQAGWISADALTPH